MLGSPLTDTTLITDSLYVLTRPLKPGAPLFWRVDATAADSATATTGTIGPVAVPAWARLTTLNDSIGVTIDTTLPTFTWSAPGIVSPPGPLTFDLFVVRPGASVPDYSISGLSDSSYTVPQPLQRNTPYFWGLGVHAGTDSMLVRSAGTFLILDASLPRATILYQNFPNPFPAAGRDETCIWFDLASASETELDILDLRGTRVRRLIPSTAFPVLLDAGRYGRSGAGGPTCDPRLTWDGRADDGRVVPAGVYLAKLRSGGNILFKRIVFRGKVE